MESELVGLALEMDFLCPILEPRCFTVFTEDEVEFERESLRLADGVRLGTVIFDRGVDSYIVAKDAWMLCSWQPLMDDHCLRVTSLVQHLFNSPWRLERFSAQILPIMSIPTCTAIVVM